MKNILHSLWRTVTKHERTKRELLDALKNAEKFQRIAEEQNRELMDLVGEHKEAKNIALVAGKSKSEFLANMSHELRTPLNAIIGFSEMMINGIGGEQCKKHKDFTNDIAAAGRHLLKLIEDILDLSKIEAGKTEIYPENVSICSIFKDCLGMIGVRAQEKEINIEIKTTCDGLYVYADPLRLKQIILNLLSNSVKFTDVGGKIDVRCIVGDNVIIVIEDNGIGMDKEGLEAALTKFGQVNANSTQVHKGTGLGLPLSIELVKLMGGSIDIVSELGTGTTAIIMLPKAK